ncbi:MAG: PAS domain S-box protein, partial [bacterium]
LFTKGKKYNVEYRIKRKDGKWIWIHDLADVVLKENEERYAYGVFTDITGRKRAENALRESEERFRKSIMKAPFPVMVHAEDGEVILVNKVWETISGYRLKEMPTVSNWTEKVYGQEKKKVKKDIEKLYKQNKKVYEGEYTIKTKGGKNLVWHFSSSPLDRDEKGRKLFLSMAHDITEQKKTEERRKQILRELNFINTTIIKISRMQSINKICEYIGNVIRKLNPNSYVAVSLYDPEVKAVTIRTLVGFEEYIDRLFDMTGKDPISIAFHPGEMDSIVNLYTSGKLENIPGGLYVLMEEKIPKVICRAAEKLLGIDKCYTVGFALKDKPYGGITILTAKGQDICYKSAIETITSHLSEILHRRQIERALEVSEERFRLAAEAVSDMVYEWDLKTDTLNWFGSLEKTLGYKEGEIKYTLQGLFELIHPTEREKIRKAVDKYRTSFNPGRDEYRIRKKDGSWRYWVDQGVPLLNDEGRPCKRIGACVDITDQQKAKEQIKKDLKEKEVLLKEIHHRVKNNLNVIVSLLNLQSNQIENKKQALTAFNETKDRVYSMALVHDQLYKSDSFSHINMNNYIRTMVRGLLSSFSKSKKITLDMNVKDIFLDINKAIPCGLLLNEIITNALKHAFPNRITGKISIEFSMKDHTYELRVKDNGIGIPENSDIDEVKTLGLKLINLLTEQIEGKLEIKRKYGTQFTVIFSENAE